MSAAAFELPADARTRLGIWRAAGERIVFTNGVYDLLHRGHVEYLEEARALGDRLVVGVNSDASVRRLKGPTRPIVPQDDRAELIAALACVDLAVIFDDDTPLALIQAVRPEHLVKGGDWPALAIVGADFVTACGGQVHSVPFRHARSTSDLLRRIRLPDQE